SMATVWHGVVNPTRPGALREWRYGDGAADSQPAVTLRQGQEMGRFLLGSTVVMLFPQGPLAFNPAWAPARPIRLGERMADWNAPA
ncbi:MAG TPA: phosphatidylserine decarboxylase, partial [Pseudorhodoferax sp.]|nr:phosphatidylserine decarboxylase [Pseudorhodoferax sp.]